MKKLCMGAAACLIAASLFAQNAGNSDKMTPPQGGTAPGLPGQMPPDGFGTVPDEQAPELAAAVVVNKVNSGKTLGAEDFRTAKPDESVLLVKDGASAKALKTLFDKAGGNVSNGGQSNFYGLNAAVVTQDGSSLTLQNVTVTTDADGANAVFSTGEGSVITIKNIRIHTHKDSSRGLDATYGGMITADKVDITTEGAHCAAFATDRGEGTVMVKGGSARTAGEGSPVIYSTGAISVSNLTGSATGSEIAVIEGKNSISIEKSRLTGGRSREWGKDVNAAVMLYQSMSGDANQGTSLFSATDSVLTSTASGPFFYVTNTNAEIRLSRTRLINPNEVLIQATGNESERGWGRKGANGGTLTLSAWNQELEGNIVVDAISSVSLTLGAGGKYIGAINAANQGKVNLSLTKKASLTLTADSYVNELDLEDSSYKNIKSNGHTLFYNKDAKANSYLHGRTVLLSDGGKLAGISMQYAAASMADAGNGEKGGAGPDGQPPVNGAMGAGGPGNMKVLTVQGALAVSGDVVTLTAGDGTVYTLSVMEAPAGGMEGKGKPPAKKGNGGPSGEPPAPPSGDMAGPGMGGQPPAGMGGQPGGKEPPKHISLEDVKAYAGKSVEIKGMMMKDKLVVFQISEK